MLIFSVVTQGRKITDGTVEYNASQECCRRRVISRRMLPWLGCEFLNNIFVEYNDDDGDNMMRETM